MVLIYRFLIICSILFLPLAAATQESCPDFKSSRKSSLRKHEGVRGQAKCSFDGFVLVSPRPIDIFPIMTLGGETAFLRYFSFGYNFGFTIKRQNRNVDAERFDGLLVRPELRFYLQKAFSGVWIGGQTTVFFQNTGFKGGLRGVQIGKSNQNGRRNVTNMYLSWAHSHQIHMVGVGMSWGFLL